jgi:hypothetical protein
MLDLLINIQENFILQRLSFKKMAKFYLFFSFTFLSIEILFSELLSIQLKKERKIKIPFLWYVINVN